MPPEFAPQTTQLKDVLRSLRYTLKKGRDTMKETAPRRLPAPASGIALSALGEIEVLARNVDLFVCSFAHSVLSDSATNSESLREIAASSRPDYKFSVAYYGTMKLVLSHLGAKRALVNQSAGRRAFVRLARSRDVFELAAQLTLQLADDGSIAIDQLDDRSPVMGSRTIVVAVFAAMLSLLAESDDAEKEAMIFAATDLAVALQEKILNIYQKRDSSALASLFERCAAHV
ncbi:hypothetical protein AMK06_PE00076 (plasmid) [Rhizobium sp. N541]|uniref:hypothetical protein n=1 Tax=unclassified Rhizobium TaxID=2613769 RepID=UPI0007EE4EBC|nr:MULTISPECIES: hypothetical protein [unclassified Rhizobium]ANM20836.1 hypothetical protein AMK06_PE00076 [Rhizobium sp. N541]ANM27217.1 hypothetical protein AMK07_PE00076 [Rhizobium sp. N941]